MITIDDLRRELAQPGKTDDECVLWFHACEQAEMMVEELTLRSCAEMLVEGVPPLTIGDVKAWLADFYDEPGADDAEIMSMIESHMRDR